MKKLQIVLMLCAMGYLAGWTVHLQHFDRKFNDCVVGWEEANTKNDQFGRELFLRCERLAHIDTAGAPFWPLVHHRWNADYVVEAGEEVP